MKVVVVPSVNKGTGRKVTQIGGSTQNYSFFRGQQVEDFDNIEAVVIPDSVEYIGYWSLMASSMVPRNLKYIVLPTRFENTGFEERYSDFPQITWIYKDVSY